jgi:hypothetical protein
MSELPSEAAVDQLARPSAAALAASNDLRLDAIVEFADLAASLARSAAEAAFRDDRLELEVQLRRLRLTVVEALKTFNELTAEPGYWRAAS